MSQIFGRTSDMTLRACLALVALALPCAMIAGVAGFSTSYVSNLHTTPSQPIPFSHEHHVGQLRIDCRYCHTSVERSSFAGMPSTKICMNCHSQIWNKSVMLEPVRASYRTGRPIEWQRVTNTPGFVYFDHRIHIHKGMGCTTCHGQLDTMPITRQASSLLMEWCIDCHRHPEKFIRPKDEVFNVAYAAPENASELGRQLVNEYGIRSSHELTSCSECHR
jgi:hypothetical protein